MPNSIRLISAAALALTAVVLLAACARPGSTPGDENTPPTTETTSPAEGESMHSLTDKYDPRVNSIYTVAGTFTDRLDASTLSAAMKLGQTPDAGPLLYNIIQTAGLTREDIVLYSEMNGERLLLDSDLIDGLFLTGEAMREALRGDYTLMANGIPYTVYELAAMRDEDFRALNIPTDALTQFCAAVNEVLARTGEAVDSTVEAFLAAHSAQ